ncbi:MAG: exodeoxyribonuclease VII small subunit [bacterium]|nr:exodeoxyribonuclease VII small subunit [bacterium]
MAKSKTGFSEAVLEVEDIITKLENDEIDIDDLSVEVKKAVKLIEQCREKLEKPETEVRDFVTSLQQDDQEG